MKRIALVLILAALVLWGCQDDTATTIPSTSLSTTVSADEGLIPTEPEQTDSTEPQPTEPTPTEPQPTEPQPTEPQPTEPQPTEPAPTEPEHAHTAVADDKVEPTCTATGLTAGSHCGTCGEILQAQQVIPVKAHEPQVVKGYAATCSATGLTDGENCKNCGKVLKAQQTLAKKDHEKELVPGKAPTCYAPGLTEGYRCRNCHTELMAQQMIPQKEHTHEIIPAVLPTEKSEGWTESSNCLYCGKKLVQSQPISRFGSSQGYDFLGTLPNGTKLQQAYIRMELTMQFFHLDGEKNAVQKAAGVYATDDVDLTGLDITKDDTDLVWKIFIADHPLYYWLGNGWNVSYYSHNNQAVRMFAYVTADYAQGSQRQKTNVEIYDSVQSMMIEANSDFALARHFHDTIVLTMDYAFKADGVTPESAAWAHTVEGYVRYGKGVCESYTEMFQLLLNYCDIPCIRVEGYAGEPHAWNLVQLDDGRWYWFDLTWDDQPHLPGGMIYDYFCVLDDQIVNEEGQTFLQTHIIENVMDLPERSEYPFVEPVYAPVPVG